MKIYRGESPHSDGVMAHIGIVKRVASHLRGRLPEYMDLDELVQVGMIGLIEATKTFDDTKGVDFELFAKIEFEEPFWTKLENYHPCLDQR